MIPARILVLTLAAAMANAQTPSGAADDGPRSRGMHSQVFREMREQAAAQPQIAKEKAKVKTETKAKVSAAAKPSGDSMLGVNLWRLHTADAASPMKIRGLKHRLDPQGTKVWTPEHVDFEQTFEEGEYVRLSLEAARKGYLYVINRDVYADGSKSAPTLIFPTLAIQGGNNLVEPGKPIEIPNMNDQPPVFMIEKTRPDQTAIELIMVLAPEPLKGVTPGREEVALPAAQVAEWERQWGTKVQLSEDHALVGKLYSEVEKNAAQGNASRLRASDPVPLTMFYRPVPGQPMLATTTIKIAKH